MHISHANPFLRAAMIQPAILEGTGLRVAYDHRIFYVLENEGALILENDTVRIKADDLLFIPPRTGYYFRGSLKVAVLNFDSSREQDNRPEPVCPPPAEQFDPSLLFDRQTIDGLDKTLIIHGDPFLRQKVTDIIKEFRSADPFADAYCSALLKELLIRILSHTQTPQNPEKLLAERIMGYIRMNAASIASNAQLAQEFGYHPVYLGEIFKNHFGISLHKAILLERIELACQWLRQTDLSIEEIAFSTGFSSRNHFCTVFGRTLECTPHQYRKKLQK